MAALKERALPTGNFDSYRILPRGISEVHTNPKRNGLSFNGTNTIYNIVKHNSTEKHLESEFWGHTEGCNHGGITPLTGTINIQNGKPGQIEGRITAVGQPAAYFDLAGLILASNTEARSKEFLKKYGDNEVPAYFASDLQTSTQTAYTAAQLAGLYVAYEHAGNNVPIALQHATPEVSKEGMIYPRSIPLPHTTFGVVDIETIKEREKDIEEIKKEQELLTPEMITVMALQVYAFIDRALKEKEVDTEGIDIKARMVEPVGFSVHFKDITPDKLTDPKTIAYVRDVFDATHKGYEQFSVKDWKDAEPTVASGFKKFFGSKRQPAYRQILHLHPDDNHLVATYSPIGPTTDSPNGSCAGGMEASGIELKRDKKYPQWHSKDEIVVFQKKVGEKIHDTIGKLHSTI